MYKRGGTTYIVTNRWHTVLYTGVSADIVRRTGEHKDRYDPRSFTGRYNAGKLVWYEDFPTIEEAIAREKQLKGGKRERKELLINALNPDWCDLYPELLRRAETGEE